MTHNQSAATADDKSAPSLQLATQDAEFRTTVRGKSVFSLAELSAKVDGYKEPARTHTRNAQAFFVRHCNSDIGQLRALASAKLNVKRSDSYFSNWLKGYYFTEKGGGNIGENSQAAREWIAFCEALAEYDRTTTDAAKLSILNTPTCRAIGNFVLDRMEPGAACRIGGIVGATGSQKTSGLKLTALKLGNRAVRMECPARPALGAFQRKLAEQWNAKVGNSRAKIEESIRTNVTEDVAIILDNCQRAYIPGRGDDQPIFNYLLELQEDTGCALILCFTPSFYIDFRKGSAEGYFEQFMGRMGGASEILELPKHSPRADLRFIAQAYDLHDGVKALEYLTDWSKMPGRIRIVFARLQRARKIAGLEGRTHITLADLKTAQDYTPPFCISDEEGGEA